MKASCCSGLEGEQSFKAEALGLGSGQGSEWPGVWRRREMAVWGQDRPLLPVSPPFWAAQPQPFASLFLVLL